MKDQSGITFSIDRSSARSLFEQICSVIRSQIIAGDLMEGRKLPPTRAFATELGVSRSTVVTAYEQLVAEGYLSSLRGSGYKVSPMGRVELKKTGLSVDPDIVEHQPSKSGPFKSSQPDMALFPYRQWAKTISRVCRYNPESMLIGDNVVGNLELRNEIARHILEWRGIKASPHQIFVTAGSGDALEICIRTLMQMGDTIGLEDPGYLPLRNYVTAQGLKIDYMKVDEFGACLPDKSKDVKLVVLTPSHQYPLGGAMSPGRRYEFISWAKENDAWVIEDDYDSEFRYAGAPIPALAGFGDKERIIYVGTFSKIFFENLRLGYVVIPKVLIETITENIKQYGVKVSYVPQQALAEFFKNGEFYRHLRRMRRIYGERRKFLTDFLEREFKDFGYFQDHQSGMQLSFHLNREFRDVDIVQKAKEKNIIVYALSRFYSKRDYGNGLILGFSSYTQEQLGKALTDLKNIFEESR